MVVLTIMSLYHSAHFKESLEVVDLSQCHGNKHQSLKEGPHDDSAIGVLIDCSMDPVSDLKYEKVNLQGSGG